MLYKIIPLLSACTFDCRTTEVGFCAKTFFFCERATKFQRRLQLGFFSVSFPTHPSPFSRLACILTSAAYFCLPAGEGVQKNRADIKKHEKNIQEIHWIESQRADEGMGWISSLYRVIAFAGNQLINVNKFPREGSCYSNWPAIKSRVLNATK